MQSGDGFHPGGMGPIQLTQGSQDQRIVKAVVNDKELDGLLGDLIKDKRQGQVSGNSEIYIARTAFTYIATVAGNLPWFNTGNIVIPYKAAVLKKVFANALFGVAASGIGQQIALLLDVRSPGQAIVTPTNWIVNSGPAGTITSNLSDTGGTKIYIPGQSIVTSNSSLSGSQVLDMPPYRFFQQGYQIFIYTQDNLAVALNDSLQVEIDLMFEITEK